MTSKPQKFNPGDVLIEPEFRRKLNALVDYAQSLECHGDGKTIRANRLPGGTFLSGLSRVGGGGSGSSANTFFTAATSGSDLIITATAAGLAALGRSSEPFTWVSPAGTSFELWARVNPNYTGAAVHNDFSHFHILGTNTAGQNQETSETGAAGGWGTTQYDAASIAVRLAVVSSGELEEEEWSMANARLALAADNAAQAASLWEADSTIADVHPYLAANAGIVIPSVSLASLRATGGASSNMEYGLLTWTLSGSDTAGRIFGQYYRTDTEKLYLAWQGLDSGGNVVSGASRLAGLGSLRGTGAGYLETLFALPGALWSSPLIPALV